ncbi:hypothetical protein OBRU01_25946 [Operophtera brumata]|uniref:Iron-binding zinc finger CDGSH type domain-containing protein n=1 Tax=Operophtera brumata TaxID=104452 RepID=A0A0L7K404_OPEBR|nr:hypothetical protein OBRU01_25946 [Operophtera brumata]
MANQRRSVSGSAACWRSESRYTELNVNYVTKAPKPEIPKNPLESVYSAPQQKDNGIIYDKKPFKISLEAGKTYHWCLCGRSKSQPLCDGTHKDVFLKISQK